MAANFQEGQSTARLSMFTSSDYVCWATRMRIYMQSNSFAIWNMTQTKYTQPTTEFSTWTTQQISLVENDSKAMNILFFSLDRMSLIGLVYVNWLLKYGEL